MLWDAIACLSIPQNTELQNILRNNLTIVRYSLLSVVCMKDKGVHSWCQYSNILNSFFHSFNQSQLDESIRYIHCTLKKQKQKQQQQLSVNEREIYFWQNMQGQTVNNFKFIFKSHLICATHYHTSINLLMPIAP